MRRIDNSSLEYIYIKYYRELYLYIFSLCKNHHVAEEIISDTFYKALLTIEESNNNIKFWLFRVAKNNWLDRLKKQKRFHPDSIDDLMISQKEDLLEKIIKDEEKREIYIKILELGKMQQEILILYYYSEFKIQEIAQVLSMSSGAIRTALCRTRHNLRNILKEEG